MEDRTTPASVRLSVPQTLVGAVGTTTVVPVNLDLIDPTSTNINGGRVTLRWDPAAFDVSNVRLGPALPGGTFTLIPPEIDAAAGTLVVGFADTMSGEGVTLPTGAAGAVVLADFAVKAGAAAGTEPINLDDQIGTARTEVGGVDGDHLLDPPPSDADTDEVDGVFEVTATVSSAALTVPRTPTGRPGDVVAVPVNLDVAAAAGVGIFSADFALRWDPAVLTASNVRVGTGIPGFVLGPVDIDPVAGVLRTGSKRADNEPVLVPQGAAGAVLLVDFTIAGGIGPQTTAVNLFDDPNDPNGVRTLLTGGDGAKPVGLNPAPGAAANDLTDGLLTVIGGPAVTAVSAVASPRNTAVAAVEVTFSEAINEATLTAADLTLTRGGTAVPLSNLTVAPVAGTPATYTVSGLAAFTDPAGEYVLTVSGAGVTNPAGTAGFGSAERRFTVERTRPTVTAVEQPATPRNTPVESVEVTFSEPLAAGAFTRDDLTLTRTVGGVTSGNLIDPTVTVALKAGSTTVYVVSGLGGLTAADGRYTLTPLAAGVTDPAGNAGDPTNTPAAAFTVDATGPTAAFAAVASPRNTPVAAVEISFNEPIDPATFSAADLALTRDGTAVDISAATVALKAGTTSTYVVSGLAAATAAAGVYLLTANVPGVADPLGNAGTGTASAGFTTDLTAPAVTAAEQPATPRATAVDTVEVTFSEPLAAGAFDRGDITLTRRVSGVTSGNLVTSAVSVALRNGSTTVYVVSGLAALTAAEGVYTLTVAPAGVTDPAGNAGAGAAGTAAWATSIGTVAVSVADVSPAVRNTAVGTVDVTFSKPIDPATFTAADLSLTVGGQPVVLTGVTVAAVPGEANTFRVSGLGGPTAAEGEYVLTASAAGVADVAGEPGAGTDATTFTVDTTAPAAPSGLGVSPDRGLSATDGRTDVGTVTVGGAVAEAGLRVALFDETTGADLGEATVTGTGFSKALTLAEGARRIRVTPTDAAGNTGPAAVLDVVVDLTAPAVAGVEQPAGPRNTPVESVEVTFSEPIDPGTFTAADLRLFRNGAAVDASGATVAAKPGTAATFVVSGLGTLTAAAGSYALTANAAGVADVAGNAGAGSKAVAWEVDLTGPAVTAVTQPTTPRNTPVDALDITFGEAPAAGSVAAADFTLTRDGTAVSLAGATVTVTGTTVRVAGLAGVTGIDGTYVFTAAGANVTDAVGNAGSGTKTATLAIDRTPPQVQGVTLPAGRPDTTPVDEVTVEFTEPIAPGSFDAADLALTRDGVAVSLAGVSVTAAGGNRFTVGGLGGSTVAQGNYTLTVAAGGVRDAAGNAGTGPGQATWFADQPPAVVSIAPVGLGSTPPVLTYRVTFTEPVDGVTAAVFRADGTAGAPAALPVTAVVPVGGRSDTFDVTVGVGVGVDGAVALGLGLASGVRDATGNGLSPSAPSDPVAVDTLAPVGRVEQAAGQADPAVGREVRFAVRFSEPVTGFGAGGVAVAGPAGTRVLGVTGGGTDYVVRVGGYTAAGTVTAEVTGGAAADAAGNPAAADNTGDRSVQVSPGGGLASTFAVGAGSGAGVGHYNPNGSIRSTRAAFAGPVGGVRTAVADFNGDGVGDVAVGTGPGGPTQVRILDGASGAELFSVAPFEPAFTGGIYLAAGDITGDGVPELVVTPDEGGGPRVQVYNGAGFGRVVDFFGIDDPNFRGGARAALGDITGDGRDDLVVSAGFGGGPRISGYDGVALAGGRFARPFTDFFLFESALRNGAFLAVGDVNGDGTADLIGGGGPGGGPRVFVVSGKTLTGSGAEAAVAAPLANFFAGNVDNRGGVRVTAKDLDGDARADVVVGDGAGAGSRVTGYLGKDFAGGAAPPAFGFDAFPGSTAGVFVG